MGFYKSIGKVISGLSELLTLDPEIIDQRLIKKISLVEFLAISFSISVLAGFILIKPEHLLYDLSNYIKAANGDYSYYYYAYWFIPVLKLFARIPLLPGYFIWGLISIACVFFAARIFGGPPVLALISYQMCYTLFQGQISGWIIGALAILWWGMAHKRWSLAGIGFLISSTKFQSGLLFAVILLLLADISWKERLRVLGIPVILSIFSLIIFPGWPLQLLSVIKQNPPDALGSIALWQWIGPYALLFWIPPLLLPFPREKRIIILAATTVLALPYFQQSDLLTLFVFPIGWLPIVGNLGFLASIFGNSMFHILALIPLAIYTFIITTSILKMSSFHQK